MDLACVVCVCVCACVREVSSTSPRLFFPFSACVYRRKTCILRPALCNWEYKGFCDLVSREQLLTLAQPSMAGLWLLSPWELTLLPYCWASAHIADFSLTSTKAVHFFEQSPLCFTMFLTTTRKICSDHWIVPYITTVLGQSHLVIHFRRKKVVA